MIGVFDSGIGGVTVMRGLLRLLPNEDYLYYSDSANCPYGDKRSEDIIALSDKIVDFLVGRGCKIIVIACNTASAVAKDYLRSKYKVPIVAIEPAYKLVPDNGKTIIMATKATIDSEEFQKLFNAYNNFNTILVPCPGLADCIEEGDKNRILSYLHENLDRYRGVKNVVLGCTHYPLIKEEIKQVLGEVDFYDGSDGVARHTKEVLGAEGLVGMGSGDVTFVDSSNNEMKRQLFLKALSA